MEYLRIQEMPDTKTDVLIMALAGWADAGEAATAALRYLSRHFKAKKFADLDPEEFYDFSQTRPYTSLTKEGLRKTRWPANELLYSNDDGSGRGLMLFLGVEPSLKWRTYAESIIDLAQRCGVRTIVHVGALLDAVPHTRQVSLTGTSNRLDRRQALEDLGIHPSSYQGPTGITSAVMDVCTKQDISFTSMWGHAPHYLHAAPNYVVSHALIKSLSNVLNINVALNELEEAAARYQQEIASAVIEDSQLSAYINKLEERYDSAEIAPGEMPRPDEVVRDLEEFLKNRLRRTSGSEPAE